MQFDYSKCGFFNFKKIVNVFDRMNLIDTDVLFSLLNAKYPDIKFEKTDFGLIHTSQRRIDQHFIDNFLVEQDNSPTNKYC